MYKDKFFFSQSNSIDSCVSSGVRIERYEDELFLAEKLFSEDKFGQGRKLFSLEMEGRRATYFFSF